MEYQLRRFRIQPGQMAAFVAAWRAGVAPLRRRHGFTIVGAWTVDGADEFVWVLAYDGPDGFAAADAVYYASPHRAALDPDPARYIEHAEHQFLTAVL